MTEEKAPSFVTRTAKTIAIVILGIAAHSPGHYQNTLDKLTPHVAGRWIGFGASLLLFCLRIVAAQGWYIVAYALFIYLLNLLLAFLTPKLDPALQLLEDEEGSSERLPTKSDEEFRPFIRRLPEFKFWLSSQKAVVYALFATLFKAFDVPVFWPILVMYFCILFAVSMKKQIAHMIKFKYVPFSWGKPKHKGKEDTSKVVRLQ